jgi:hypothetical protein
MQLTQRRRKLALAALTLLGGSAAHAESDGRTAASGQPAVIDTGLLWYQENDSRIKDAEAIVDVRQPLGEDRAWNARLTLDAVCGGSPIGALPSKSTQSFFTPSATTVAPQPVVQTTTSSSGGGGNLSLCSNPVQNQHYTVAPGQLPLDQSFQDQRIAVSGGYEAPIGTQNRYDVGAALSHERDFLSASVNGLFSRDFDSRNTTLAAGLNLEADAIQPVGGTPVPWSQYGQFQKGGNRNRQVQNAILGVTQIMTRRWITQGNLSFEHSSGYQTDPYKIISVLDAQGYDPNGLYVYESRPETRNRVAIFWDNKYAFDHDVLQASYRHTQDTWGVHSDTVEMHYRFAMGAFGYLEPHLRGYRQTAANFFTFYVDQGSPQTGYASADPRLASFTGRTFGLKYGIPVGSDGGELSLRAERYSQRGSGPSNVPVGLQGLDLYPGMTATIVQLGLRLNF